MHAGDIGWVGKNASWQHCSGRVPGQLTRSESSIFFWNLPLSLSKKGGGIAVRVATANVAMSGCIVEYLSTRMHAKAPFFVCVQSCANVYSLQGVVVGWSAFSDAGNPGNHHQVKRGEDKKKGETGSSKRGRRQIKRKRILFFLFFQGKTLTKIVVRHRFDQA